MTPLAWIAVAAVPIAIALTSWSYRIQAAVERKAWERKVAAAETLARGLGDGLDATAAELTAANGSAARTAQVANRLRRKLLTQAPRVFPAAPRSGDPLRVVPEGESPIHDALEAERARVVPIKTRAKKAAKARMS